MRRAVYATLLGVCLGGDPGISTLQPLEEDDELAWHHDVQSYVVVRKGAQLGFVVDASATPVQRDQLPLDLTGMALQTYTDLGTKSFDPQIALLRKRARDIGCWNSMYTPDVCCSNGGWLACESESMPLETCCAGWWTSKDPIFVASVQECLDSFMRAVMKQPQLRNPHHLHGSFYARLLATSGRQDLVLAEVGVDEGAFMAAMLEELEWLGVTVKKYYAIDPWADETSQLQQAVDVALQFKPKVHLIQETGAIASRLVHEESMDFVFVDAVHTVPFVSLHLRSWWPKVRPGGILAGHDFAPEKPWRFPGPLAGATRFAQEMGLRGRLLGLHGTTFAIHKPT